MKTSNEILETLGGFSGTESYHRHGTINLTDGADYVRKSCDAFWLMDIVDSLRFCKKVKNQDFVVFGLKVDKTKNNRKFDAVFTAEDGNGGKLYKQNIEYTDFPLNNIKFFFANNVLMLPGEY